MSYDPDLITSYFDSYGEAEWERLVSSPKNLMSLHIHQHYLQKYLKPGDRVLELGAGSGRYTIFMAQQGAEILTSDISEVQLQLNKKKVEEAGFVDSVLGWKQLDIVDLSEIEEQFDVVVAIGGPLSYTLDQRAQAMEQMLSKVKPGGLLFLGVMSRWGGMQRLIRNYTQDLIDGDTTIIDIFETGDDYGYLAFEGHNHHMFTYQELKEFVSDYPVTELQATATAYLCMGKGDHLVPVARDKQAWAKLVQMELEIGKRIVDGGSHMLMILQKDQ